MTSKISADQINDWLMAAPRARSQVRQAFECSDGFRISIQASEGHYCEPRIDSGPWTHVEVGYPNRIEPLLWQYAEEPGKWTDTVYPRVPVEVVAAVVELHGGFSTMQTRPPV